VAVNGGAALAAGEQVILARSIQWSKISRNPRPRARYPAGSARSMKWATPAHAWQLLDATDVHWFGQRLDFVGRKMP